MQNARRSTPSVQGRRTATVGKVGSPTRNNAGKGPGKPHFQSRPQTADGHSKTVLPCGSEAPRTLESRPEEPSCSVWLSFQNIYHENRRQVVQTLQDRFPVPANRGQGRAGLCSRSDRCAASWV